LSVYKRTKKQQKNIRDKIDTRYKKSVATITNKYNQNNEHATQEYNMSLQEKLKELETKKDGDWKKCLEEISLKIRKSFEDTKAKLRTKFGEAIVKEAVNNANQRFGCYQQSSKISLLQSNPNNVIMNNININNNGKE